MTRTLRLRREALTELTGADLAAVVAGAPPTLDVRACLASADCISDDHTCIDCLTRWC